MAPVTAHSRIAHVLLPRLAGPGEGRSKVETGDLRLARSLLAQFTDPVAVESIDTDAAVNMKL